ncbi:MAG: 3'-5' exonuclease [Bacteroidaceae bacterium]|nr:3'-5' exonuclease [Bacteroidaceae bacterium]
MKPILTRPLVVFDLESTGLDIATARIIQLSYILVQPDGTEERGDHFVDPEMSIPQEVVELTHITDDMVKGQPTFKQLAPALQQKFEGCDFAGYNSNYFDIPLLAEEFLRAGIFFDFSKVRCIDVCSIFKNMERRNLAAAYKFYCGRKMEDDFQAHLASEDTEATWKVLQGQLDMYAPGQQEEPERQMANDVDSMAAASASKYKNVDFAGRLVYNEKGEKVINFGKYKGQVAKEVLRRDPSYYSWIMQGDFTLNTKMEFKKIYAGC